MAKLSTTKPSGTQRVLVYGPPKVGKTQLVGALAEHFNLIWFDLENGHDTLYKFPHEWQERIELISLPDSRSFPVAAETMLKVIKGDEHSICELHGKIFCMDCMKHGRPSTKVRLDSTLGENTIVVIDSLTQLSTSFIAHMTKDRDDLYKMQTDDWGNLSKLVEIFLSHVQAAKFNIICIIKNMLFSSTSSASSPAPWEQGVCSSCFIDITASSTAFEYDVPVGSQR